MGQGLVIDAWRVGGSVALVIELTVRYISADDSIDSIAGMKSHLPALRKKLNSDPVYFKKVYMHTFDLAKAPGARTLVLDSGEQSIRHFPKTKQLPRSSLTAAIDLWNLYIPPALAARPSALARIPAGEPPNSSSNTQPPAFTSKHLEMWCEFQRKKGKAVSKDTWSLFVDFARSIDKDFKEYDDSGECSATIPVSAVERLIDSGMAVDN